MTTKPHSSQILVTPSGNISSTNVQSALVELDSEKQSALVSGTNIKTINTNSLLGSGNLSVQDTLVSGTNIKTINNTSILGSGNISISGGTASAADVTFTPSGNISSTDVQSALVELDSEKQSALVSGTNIKTINNTSILGSGNISISGGTVPVKFITDFGANGDGLTSSVTANNTAIADALTYIYSTGYNVIVPPGIYVCDPFSISSVAYAGQGSFVGIDRERCVFKRNVNTSGPTPFVTIGSASNTSFQAGMGMSKIKLDGGVTTNGPAIRMYDVVRARFEDCQFTGGSIACDMLGGISITFGTCLFEQATIGVKIDKFTSAAGGGWPNSIHFEGGEMVDNTLLGMWVDYARMVSLSHIDIEGNGTSLAQSVQGGVYVGPNMGQEVSINDTFSIGVIVESCWFEGNKGLADIHILSGISSIEKSTFFSASNQTTNDIRIEGGRYAIRTTNSSFTKTHNLYESSGVENGNIIMTSDLPGLFFDALKTTIHGNSTISMRGGSVPIATGILKPLIQGGSSTADTNGLLTVTFPTSYQFVPTAISCTPIDTTAGTLVSCSIVSASTTGFTAQIDYMGQVTSNPIPGANIFVSWISIGAGY